MSWHSQNVPSIELKQHNIFDKSVKFGTGIVNDDGTCLYLDDCYNINIIHCIEMKSNGTITYTPIKNSNMNLHPEKRIGSPLIFHNNSIWMYGAVNGACESINRSKNELWIFDLNTKQWSKKAIKFIESSIDNDEPKHIYFNHMWRHSNHTFTVM